MSDGYQALREGAAILDLSGHGLIRAGGEDRVRLLHAMCTQHVEELTPGRSCYAFFLNAQGRILADAQILCFRDHLLIETEPETREKLWHHLDRYIIADDVTLSDVSEEQAVIGIEGPRAGAMAGTLGLTLPEGPGAFVGLGAGILARLSSTGAPGFRLIIPLAEKPVLIERLRGAGAVTASAEAARTVRIENGHPRYGEDLSEDYIPHETQMLSAVHFNKGCYLGQEIVERVRSRGRVNKLLMRLRIPGARTPAAGALLRSGDKEAGLITSAAWSPALGEVVALGYVRALYAKQGRELSGEGFTAQVRGGTGA